MQVCVRNIKVDALIRKHHVAVPLNGRGSCLLAAGVAQSPINVNHFVIFSPSDRSAIVYSTSSTNGPKKRSGHVGVLARLSQYILPKAASSADGRVEGLLMIGGWGGCDQGALVQDYWFLDTLTFSWSRPLLQGDLPETVNLGLLENWTDTEVVLYRGGDGLHHNSDIWILNLINGIWRRIKRRAIDFAGGVEPWPAERTSPCGCVLPGPRLILGGGWNSTGILDDWWLFDGTRWMKICVTGPVGKRTGAKLIYLSWARMVCLIGGKSGNDSRTPSLLIAPITKSFLKATIDTDSKKHANFQCEAPPQLDFREPATIDGCVPGLVGHDACVVDSSIVITGGTDTIHREPLPGALVLELLALSEFSKTDRDLHSIFRRPIGSFDYASYIKFAGNTAFADATFRVGEYDLPCHQLMLASKSEYFRCYFSKQRHSSIRLSAPAYVNPCVFELFLTTFYSSHLPTCLMIPEYRTAWEPNLMARPSSRLDGQAYGDSTKQTIAILLGHCASANYDEILAGKAPKSLPFNDRAISDTVTTLLILTQLADQYLCDKTKICLEIYLACLAHTPAIQDRLHQASRALNLNKLHLFLERACHIRHRANHVNDLMTSLIPLASGPDPLSDSNYETEEDLSSPASSKKSKRSQPGGAGFLTNRSQRITSGRTDEALPSLSLDDSSDLLAILPQLKERNYGSGIDLGRQPGRAISPNSSNNNPNFKSSQDSSPQKKVAQLFRNRGDTSY